MSSTATLGGVRATNSIAASTVEAEPRIVQPSSVSMSSSRSAISVSSSMMSTRTPAKAGTRSGAGTGGPFGGRSTLAGRAGPYSVGIARGKPPLRTPKAVPRDQDGRSARLFCERAAIGSALALLRIAIAAGRRGLDHDRFARPDAGRIAAFEALHAAIAAPNPVLADLSWLAAGEPERPHPAMARQDGAIHFFQEPDGAAHAVARVPLPAPARSRPHVEILEQHRIAELQHLGIGQARVGHVGVDRVGAVEARPRRGARADRLVILIFVVAEIEIVYGA